MSIHFFCVECLSDPSQGRTGPKAQNYFGIPDLSRNPETISGFPKLGFLKIWFGIGIEIGIPENFGMGIGTRVSV
ncbi:hypothetical protein DVH24_031488 [Malus domestica]|uniref:Uncharacterized protein n=1 Tax=Malus domestica TaxID=3750 RepID=A0A498HI16_MALDO|nr:hypothetical protein DVH24_031488 [Malus domestica]